MAGHRFVQRGVPGIDQPRQLATAPPYGQIDTDIQHGCDRPDAVQRRRTRMAPFELGYERPSHTGASGDIFLAPATAQSDRPEGCSHPPVVHADDYGRELFTAAYSPLIDGVEAGLGAEHGADFPTPTDFPGRPPTLLRARRAISRRTVQRRGARLREPHPRCLRVEATPTPVRAEHWRRALRTPGTTRLRWRCRPRRALAGSHS